MASHARSTAVVTAAICVMVSSSGCFGILDRNLGKVEYPPNEWSVTIGTTFGTSSACAHDGISPREKIRIPEMSFSLDRGYACAWLEAGRLLTTDHRFRVVATANGSFPEITLAMPYGDQGPWSLGPEPTFINLPAGEHSLLLTAGETANNATAMAFRLDMTTNTA